LGKADRCYRQNQHRLRLACLEGTLLLNYNGKMNKAYPVPQEDSTLLETYAAHGI
jgi:hypothetical protein